MALDLEKIRREAEGIDKKRESQSRQSDLNWYEWKENGAINKLRFLPSTDSLAGALAYKVHTHGYKGVYSQIGIEKAPICPELNPPSDSSGVRDPLCAMLSDLRSRGYEVGDYDISIKAYFNAIDRDNEAAGVQIVRAPISQVYDWLVLQIREYSTLVSFQDPEQGYDLHIKVEGTGFSRKYHPSWIPGPSTLLHSDPSIRQKWLDERFDLTKIFKSTPVDQMAKIAEDIKTLVTKGSSKSSLPPTMTPSNSGPLPADPRVASGKPWCFGIEGIKGFPGHLELSDLKSFIPQPIRTNGIWSHSYDRTNPDCLRCPYDFSCSDIVLPLIKKSKESGQTLFAVAAGNSSSLNDEVPF